MTLYLHQKLLAVALVLASAQEEHCDDEGETSLLLQSASGMASTPKQDLLPSAGEPALSEVWRSEGLDAKQSYYWHRGSATSSDIALVYVHGLFATALDDQVTDQFFGQALDWGFAVCSFDAADHGKTRLLIDENAGKTEEEIRCSNNGGFAMTAAKGAHYEQRYVEPVRRFPTHCTGRLEELLGRRKGSMRAVLFGHGWGGLLTMMSLQTTKDFAGPDSRIIASVTADMGLDSNEFEWDLVTQGATFLTALHKKARWLPANLPVKVGITWRDTFLEGVDPDSKLRSGPCPKVEKDEQRKVTMSWGEAGYKVVDAVLEPTPGAYIKAVPTLHVYCDQDAIIVPDYIRRAAFSQDVNRTLPVCVVDVAQYGRCSHVSFPGRTTGWDEQNTPWQALKTWLSTADAAANSTAEAFSSCPLGTLTAAEAIQLTTTLAPL